MSANEYLIDASTRHQIMLQRLSGGSFNKLKPILEKLQKDIRARLAENQTDFQMNRLTALMRDIQALFDVANSEVSKLSGINLELVYETISLKSHAARYLESHIHKLLPHHIFDNNFNGCKEFIISNDITKVISVIEGEL